MRSLICCGFLVFLVALGCGQQARESARHVTSSPEVVSHNYLADSSAEGYSANNGYLAEPEGRDLADRDTYRKGAVVGMVAPDEAAVDSESSGAVEARRVSNTQSVESPKIIYTAEVSLRVDDFDQAQEDIKALVEQANGYVAKSSLQRNTGSSRWATWTLRVPSGRYSSVLDRFDDLGLVESRSESADDVTRQYIDLTARRDNFARLEARLIDLLEKRDGKIEEVIKVEKELARVRTEIERISGELRYLTNRVGYSTINLSVREEREFVHQEEPTLVAEISQTWNGSLANLSDFGERLLLGFIAVFPWLVTASVVIVPLAFLASLRRRKAVAAAK
ncbi:DUF4349 domain-containing protein [Stratiformator vulcanicus]|uniref:DUF4349 domain-containing protein n=1 Tax=Stratiformator vulcanicus TaxID=2527980 RepID=A0A517QVQ2_9PLAN|nr:DUF4349 domain-containing protein [Stratiformator vulcanicus]QDT35739.1 hypothetical protein Pan189_00920 [Stratiformator vulcanicus]